MKNSEEDRFDLGKGVGIEIGKKVGYSSGYKDGFECGKEQGYTEGRYIGLAEAPRIIDYSLNEFLDSNYNNFSGLDVLVEALMDYVGNSPYYRCLLKEKLEEKFKV